VTFTKKQAVRWLFQVLQVFVTGQNVHQWISQR